MTEKEGEITRERESKKEKKPERWWSKKKREGVGGFVCVVSLFLTEGKRLMGQRWRSE